MTLDQTLSLRDLLFLFRASDGRCLYQTVKELGIEISRPSESEYWGRQETAITAVQQMLAARRPLSQNLFDLLLVAIRRRTERLPEQEQVLIRARQLMDGHRMERVESKPVKLLRQAASEARTITWFTGAVDPLVNPDRDPVAQALLDRILSGLRVRSGPDERTGKALGHQAICMAVPSRATGEVWWQSAISRTLEHCDSVRKGQLTARQLHDRVLRVTSQGVLRIVPVGPIAHANVLLLNHHDPTSASAFNYYTNELSGPVLPILLRMPQYAAIQWSHIWRDIERNQDLDVVDLLATAATVLRVWDPSLA